ncbi:hypothetical protein JD844_033304, partial [Phrynosoma platyrhinos]
CHEGNLNSFALNVEAANGADDDTAANSIQFSCTDGTVLKGRSEVEYFKMDLSIGIVIFLIFSCCVWDTESRSYNAILTVSNGGKWGDWGKAEFCPQGYARSFSIKVNI